MRVVFMGTPHAAVPSLRALDGAFEVLAVYTRPDKPKGRGRSVEASPVKSAASDLSLDVRQPKTLKHEAGTIAALSPDVIAVVAYGAILRPDVLAIPRLGCVNVHFSLLPRWRGAAPVERAILAGDERTGVATMLMDEGLDTGPILLEEVTPIGPEDTTGSLTLRLAGNGAPLLVNTLNELDLGTLEPRPQPADGATYAEKVTVDEARIDPTELAVIGERKTRAFDPSPGAFVMFRDKRLKVWRATVEPGRGEVGTFVDGALQTTDGRLRFLEVQPEGKRRISGEDFARGYRPEDGEPVA
ncbi:MAG: methionyl-tRNA formyltransferase [Actinomycetota bacterium]